MTHGRMQTMTHGSERISLAQKPIGVSRGLSVAVAMFALAAFLVGTAGTGFAKSKSDHKNKNVGIFDTIVVPNGAPGTFAGSLATFLENSHPNTPPFLWVKGPNTLLDAASAPAGVAVSS